MTRKYKKPELTQAQQLFLMESKFPQFFHTIDRQRSIVWEGSWRPTDISDNYTIRISYKQGLRPTIAILKPKLVLARGHDQLPHTYNGQTDICVHQPKEWNKGLAIADTIMPWISQWLYFYEIWRVTGKWLGKGTHPNWPQHKGS